MVGSSLSGSLDHGASPGASVTLPEARGMVASAVAAVTTVTAAAATTTASAAAVRGRRKNGDGRVPNRPWVGGGGSVQAAWRKIPLAPPEVDQRQAPPGRDRPCRQRRDGEEEEAWWENGVGKLETTSVGVEGCCVFRVPGIHFRTLGVSFVRCHILRRVSVLFLRGVPGSFVPRFL